MFPPLFCGSIVSSARDYLSPHDCLILFHHLFFQNLFFSDQFFFSEGENQFWITYRENESCVIVGETGSGKTTQIPQVFLLLLLFSSLFFFPFSLTFSSFSLFRSFFSPQYIYEAGLHKSKRGTEMIIGITQVSFLFSLFSSFSLSFLPLLFPLFPFFLLFFLSKLSLF